MKTSFDLSEPLLDEVRALAKQRGTTTKSLVEQALVKLLEEARQVKPFKLRDLSFGGGGLTPEFENATWAEILEVARERPGLPGSNG
jgi:predicted DNA-binding ribbon-helix-helix protein